MIVPERRLGTLARCVSIVLCMGLLSGCIPNQKQEIDKYRAVLDERVDPPADIGPIVSLRDAMALANARNEQLAFRGETYLQSLIERDRLAGNFLPTVSLVPSYYRQDPTSSSGSSASTINDRRDVPVNAQINVFNGFRDVTALRAAGANTEAQLAQLRDVQDTILLNVARTYYQILISEQAVRVLDKTLTLQDALLRQMRVRVEVGVARPSLDIAQAEAQRASIRVSQISAANDARVGREILSFLTFATIGQKDLGDNLPVPPELPALADLQTDALARRSDLAAARAAIETARQNVRNAFGRYFPSVSLNVNYFLSRQSLPTDSDWNGLISANIPIFAAGQIRAAVRNSHSQFRQASLNESLLSRQALQEVAIAYENFATSGRRLAQLEIQVRAAQAAFDLARRSYEEGLVTYLDELVAQDRLATAELQLATERFNNKLFYLNLLRSTGRLTDILKPAAAQPTTQPTTQPATRPIDQFPPSLPTTAPTTTRNANT